MIIRQVEVVVTVQSLSRVRLSATSWTAARQASLSITIFQSLLTLMSIELVMPSNHLILGRPLLFLPSISPSVRVISNESAFRIRWPKDWSFSFNISPSNERPGLISSRMLCSQWWTANWKPAILKTGLWFASSTSPRVNLQHHSQVILFLLLTSNRSPIPFNLWQKCWETPLLFLSVSCSYLQHVDSYHKLINNFYHSSFSPV